MRITPRSTWRCSINVIDVGALARSAKFKEKQQRDDESESRATFGFQI